MAHSDLRHLYGKSQQSLTSLAFMFSPEILIKWEYDPKTIHNDSFDTIIISCHSILSLAADNLNFSKLQGSHS